MTSFPSKGFRYAGLRCVRLRSGGTAPRRFVLIFFRNPAQSWSGAGTRIARKGGRHGPPPAVRSPHRVLHASRVHSRPPESRWPTGRCCTIRCRMSAACGRSHPARRDSRLLRTPSLRLPRGSPGGKAVGLHRLNVTIAPFVGIRVHWGHFKKTGRLSGAAQVFDAEFDELRVV